MDLEMQAKLAVIGLVVEDMARSLAFYRRLGLELPPEGDQQPHVEAALSGGLRLAFDTVDTVRSFDPEWSPPSGSARMALAFRVDDVDRAYDELTSLGYKGHKAPWDAFWGQRYAVIHDPDGNGVDLFVPLDAS